MPTSFWSRSPKTSLSYRGLVTFHRTVKWSIVVVIVYTVGHVGVLKKGGISDNHLFGGDFAIPVVTFIRRSYEGYDRNGKIPQKRLNSPKATHKPDKVSSFTSFY